MSRHSAAALALALVACLCLFASSARAQGSGSIVVTVMDPDGAVFTEAFVTITSETTSATSNVTSAGDGTCGTGAIAAGSYALSVNVPGMQGFARSGIVVTPGEVSRLEVRLEDGPSLRTLGEDPESIAALFLRRPPPPSGATPRMPDGRPDLSGMWLGGPAAPGDLDMLPWAQALTTERQASNSQAYPPTYCLPGGPAPLMASGFFALAQTSNLLIMLFETDTPGYRQVFLDGRGHREDFGLTWMGHSVGAWDGDTLVIDSIGFGDRGWIDFSGHPHTDGLHVTQRIRRPDLGQLEIAITVDDPGAYRRPWTVEKTATLVPDEEILEYVCTENNKELIRARPRPLP